MAEERQGHVKYIRVRQADGSFTDAMLIAVSPYNVDFEDGTNLVEKLEEKAEKRYYGDTSINVGRIPGTDTGTNSIAVGENVTAKGNQSVSLGISTSAENEAATALGKDTKAVGKYSVAQGESTYAGGYASVAEGYQSSATGKYSHAQGEAALATGEDSFASGYNTVANGKKATALGEGTIATGNNSLVHGKYNIEDTENKYAEIIGNGLDDENRSDIYTLDWQGNAIFKGNVRAERFDGKAYYDAKGNEITDYIIKITSNKNKLEYTTGAGKKTQIELMGFSEKTTQYYSWTNENPGVINNSNKEICVMVYGGAISESEKPGAIFMAQLLINASPTKDTLTLEFELKIDGNLINPNWKPTEILTKGPHIITLMYPLDELEVNHTHKFQLGAKCLEENATINYDIGDIKCVLYGIGFPGGGGEPLEEDISYLRHFEYRNLSEINIFWNDYNTIHNTKNYVDKISFQTISDFDNFNYNGILSYRGATMYYTYNNLYRNLNLYSNSNKYYFNKNCSKMFLSYYSDYYNNAQIYNSKGSILKARMAHSYVGLFRNIEIQTYNPIVFYENAFDLVEDLSMFIGDFNDSNSIGQSYIGREQDAPASYWIRLGCSFIPPKKMPNVVNMYRSFYYGNLNGNPIETPKVINMAYTYYNCYNIKGNPTCGKETNNMAYTYHYCMNLTGSPVCSFNTDNMAYTYCNCNNLTGSPVCGENTYNMRGAYSGCYRLTGNPVCSLKTDDLANAYYRCQKLTGAPVSSDYTTDMNYTYYSCYNIKGSPSVGNSVKSLYYTYYNCYNITGTGILGPLVENIEHSYDGCVNLSYPDTNESNWTYIINANYTYADCTNLLACYCGNQVKTMNNTYYHCPNVTGIAAVGPAVENMLSTYAYSGISKPVVHDNLKKMIYTYQNTKVSVPLCGNYVFDFSGCYSECSQIKTAVRGPEVKDLNSTYQSCKNLTTAVVGPKVTTMDSTYANCTSLKKPVFEYPDCLLSMNRTYENCAILDTAACGNNVKYMRNTYNNCPKIKTAVCGPEVTDMVGTYMRCPGLTILTCGNKVINMINTYRGTHFKQVVEPVCGPEVVTMINTYYECRNIIQAVCGEKVKYMKATYYNSSVKYAACGDNVLTLNYIIDHFHNQYYMLGPYANCNLLIQSACGNNVTDMAYAYYNCCNLKNFVSGPKVTIMDSTYANCTSYIYKGNVYHTSNFSPTYNAFICFPIDMSQPVAYRDIVDEADIACDFACGDNVWTMNYTYSNLKAPAYRAFNLATRSKTGYDQDGIPTYEYIDSGIQIPLLKGNISAPVIGNNVYCAVHAYYNYMKGYYGGETYMRYNGYARINITNCFYGRKSWSPLLNIYVAEGSRMNNAFYFCDQYNSPFGGLPTWEIHEEENYYYTPQYNTRIYYCNEDELGRTYHGEELINEPTCEEEGKYYKYYTDKDGNEGIKIRYIPALGHDIDEITQTCKRCGKQLKANVWIHKKDAGSLPNHFMAIDEEGTEFRPILFNEEDPTDTQGCNAQDKWEIICDRDIEYTFKIEATDYYHLTSQLRASKFYIALDGKRLVGNETESYVFITPLSLEEN